MRRSSVATDKALNRRGLAKPTLLLLVFLGLTTTGWAQERAPLPNGPAAGRRQPERLAFAARLLRDRRYDLAADEYEGFLTGAAVGADTNEARYGLATARLFLGQHAEARKQFELFLKQAPSHPNAPTARFRIGEAAYLLGELPTARQALEAYTSDSGARTHLDTAWTYLGDIGYRQNDLPAARRAYETALVKYPRGRLVDRARFGLARTLMAQKQYDAALVPLMALVQGGGPDWADKARLQIALVQIAAARPAEAVKALEELEQASPRSPLVAEARLRRAEALGQLDRAAEAEALLGPLAASDIGPAAQAAYGLALIQLKQGKATAALTTCDDALKRFPNTPLSPLLWYRSAEAAQAADQFEEARTRFLKVVEAYPKDEWADDALLRAAELSLKSSDPAQARTLAGSFATRFPNSPLRMDAQLVEAQAAQAAKDAKGAIALLEPLLTDSKLTPELTTSVRLALGVAYREIGQPDKAQEVLRGMTQAAPDVQYVLGVSHFDAKRYDEAILALDAYLTARPQGDIAPDALALLAIAHQELGQGEEARKALDRLMSAYPNHKVLAQTHLRLGEAALDAKDHARAAELLRAAAAAATDPAAKARSLWGLGWAQLSGGHAADAAESFTAAVQAAPQSPLAPDAALACARALDEAGQSREALAAYDRAIETYAKNEKAVASANLGRARLLDRQGRHAEAAEAFGRYLVLAPTLPPGGESVDVVLAEQGWALLDAEKPAEGLANFRRILDEFPTSARTMDARVALAEAAYTDGKHDQVETLLEPVVAETSKADAALIQNALYRLGLSRFDRHEWEKATTAFDRLLIQHADSPLAAQARFWKAETALQAGDVKTAELEFAALMRDPKPARAPEWLATARLRHVESLVLLKRWNEALTEADALKAEQPQFPAAHELEFARGQALQGLARFDEARSAFQFVIDANRADDFAARAQLMRGETFFHQQKYAEALKEYLRAVYNFDTPAIQATALFEAGQVAEKLDRWSDAVDFYTQLTAKFANEPIAMKAAERLEAAKQKAVPKDQPSK